jgi:hypothetical protein
MFKCQVVRRLNPPENRLKVKMVNADAIGSAICRMGYFLPLGPDYAV